MDFKVAGTEKGVTALQMDMKISGLPVSIILKPSRKLVLQGYIQKMQEAMTSLGILISPAQGF